MATNNKQTPTIRLSDIDVLTQPHCKIKDPERVEKILNVIVNGGTEDLQIVTDFDFTLTKQKTDTGKPTLSSFGMFNKCQSVPESYREETKKLYKFYRPIELDPSMDIEEKRVKLIEWWQKGSELLKGFRFDPQDFNDFLPEYGHMLRTGTQDLLKLTHQCGVPVLVFSAGLGDSIDAVMKHEQVLYPNVKIVSNFLKIDENGMVNGFREDQAMIHTFNKNETALEGTEYYDSVQNRQHIILMGDSLPDADMAEGVPKTSSILKIGFLFDHPEDNLPKYLDTFDIVLIDDQTMNIPNKILSLVVNGNENETKF